LQISFGDFNLKDLDDQTLYQVRLYYRVSAIFTLNNGEKVEVLIIEISNRVNVNLLPRSPFEKGHFMEMIQLPILSTEQTIIVKLVLFNDAFSQEYLTYVSHAADTIDQVNNKF
jgi:hypothetical protein